MRSASGFDAFVFSLAAISVGIMVEWGNFFGRAFYPGASMVLALAIATAAAFVIAWAYQYWGQIFPRSGGDYVFLSRGAHPGLALGVNFVYCWTLMVSPAFAMSIMQPLFSSFAAALADSTGWQWLGRLSAWFATDPGYAVIGSASLLVAASIAVFGLKRAIQYMKVLFLAGIVGEAILVVALLASNSATFERNLEQSTGQTAAALEKAATDSGYASGGFDLWHTIQLTNWFTTSLFFAALLLYIGGEIKSSSRNIRYAMLGAVAACGVGTLAWIGALAKAIPTNLQGALAWNYFVVPESATAQMPYAHELMRILWGTHGFGLVLTIIGFLTVLAWVTLWTPLVLSFTQRAILAWALDGLTPRWVGSVNERWHTPLPALTIALVMGESFMLIFAFQPSWRTIILLVPLFIGIGVTMLVGTFFPYVRKDLVAQSVVADAKLFGIHKMSIFCGLGTVIMAFAAWLMLDDTTASGTNRTPIWVTAGIVAGITIYYLALQAYKRSKGEDISATFKRIPVE